MKRRMGIAATACLLAACGEQPTAITEPALDVTPSFSVVDLAGPNDVTYGILHGTVRFWNTQVTAVSSGTFSGNAALVPPGASVTLSGTMQRGEVPEPGFWDLYCPTCIIQTYIAWVAPAAANGATPINLGLESDINGYWSLHPAIDFTWTTTAPTVDGTYYLGEGESWEYFYWPHYQGTMGWVTGDPNTLAASFIIQVRADPSTKDDCKNGGWVSFGFKNQGQCVRFIETGKDSR